VEEYVETTSKKGVVSNKWVRASGFHSKFSYLLSDYAGRGFRRSDSLEEMSKIYDKVNDIINNMPELYFSDLKKKI